MPCNIKIFILNTWKESVRDENSELSFDFLRSFERFLNVESFSHDRRVQFLLKGQQIHVSLKDGGIDKEEQVIDKRKVEQDPSFFFPARKYEMINLCEPPMSAVTPDSSLFTFH